jgi:uncharacterized protein
MIRGIFKIVVISLLTISFTACEKKQKEEEKEVKFTPKLAIPEWDETGGKKIWKVYKNWHAAKHDPIPATKIGYAYSEELKDYEKAIQWYKYSDSMIPLGENSYFTCYAYQQLKQYDEAIKWCQNSIDLKWDKALILLGTVYEDSSNYNKAVDYYKQAFDKTKDAIAANNLGYLYSTKLNDFTQAEKWYKEAIKLNHYSAYQSFATFYYEDLKDNIKASAYAIALINTEYTKSSVIKLLKDEWKIPNETIKKGYELQLNSPDFPVKFKDELNLKD